MNDRILQNAWRLHQAGRFAEAAHLYNEVLGANPRHARALQMLGYLHFQRGEFADADRVTEKALKLDPMSVDALCNRGRVLQALARHKEALDCFDRALALKGDCAPAIAGRGNALAQMGRFEDAAASFSRAIALGPNDATLYLRRGTATAMLGRDEAALKDFESALARDPANIAALHSRSRLLRKEKRIEEALSCIERILALDPTHAEAVMDRAVSLVDLKRYDEALAAFDWALRIAPGNVEALTDRASVLLGLKRHEAARADASRALAADPNNAAAWHNLGGAFAGLRRHKEALASFDKSLALVPDNAAGWTGRGGALLALKQDEAALASTDSALRLDAADADAWTNRAHALSNLKRFSEAIADSDRALSIDPASGAATRVGIHARLHACDWKRREEDKRRVTAGLRAGARLISMLDHRALLESEEENLIAARLWVAERHPAENPLWRGERYRHGKIRLAYLSTDFRAHAVAFLIAGNFEHHDKARFEITAISFGLDDKSQTRQRIESAFDRFIDAQDLSDAQIAATIREMEIDIAVDLNGYTGDARTGILAFRPAPVQVNYLGYPGTMGAGFMDYIVADRTVIPPEHQIHFSEKVVYLPHAYQANDRKRRASAQTPTRAKAGLPDTGFVFVCFNNLHKIGPEMFDIWMRLLREVEGSVLWLLEDNLIAAANLMREAEARGVPPGRLVFAPRRMPEEHLARLRLADLFLDTLPYNAHTTASDALWMGLPLLTCPGQTFPARVAASLLNAIGVPELVTDSLTDYEALALRLARDPEKLAAIKATLARNRDTHPLFNTLRFTRDLESAYTTMWERYQAGLAPESFAVSVAQT